MSTAIHLINLNFDFKLISRQTNIEQAALLRHALDEIKAAGVEISCGRVPSLPSVSRTGGTVSRNMGPNETELLKHTGKCRMRCPIGQDRETFAAMVLKERFNVVLDITADVSDSNTSAGDTEVFDEEDDKDVF